VWAFAFTDGNGYGHGCSIGHAHSDCNSDGDGNSDPNAYCIANTEVYSHTTAASYVASSTVSLRAYMQLSSGTREAIREFPKSHELLYRGGRVTPKIKVETVAAATPQHAHEADASFIDRMGANYSSGVGSSKMTWEKVLTPL
jgi:hypothetical protein